MELKEKSLQIKNEYSEIDILIMQFYLQYNFSEFNGKKFWKIIKII